MLLGVAECSLSLFGGFVPLMESTANTGDLYFGAVLSLPDQTSVMMSSCDD